MIKSMTGYGKETVKSKEIEVTAEIRSLNGKGLRIRYSMPRFFNPLTLEIQNAISEVIKRGDVDLHLTYRFSPEFVPEVSVNYQEAIKYIKAASKLSGLSGKEISINLTDLLSIPEIFQKEEVEVEPFKNAVLEAVKKALQTADKSRKEEGKRIKAYLEERLEEIEKTLNVLEDNIKEIEKKAFEKLKEKAKKLLNELKEEVEEELEKRVELEVALIAEKQDVSEEISRLKIHIERFRKLMENEEPVGKTLDFLCQEMHREINTLGSKVREIDVTEEVLKIKSEIAKIKEQVQNVE